MENVKCSKKWCRQQVDTSTAGSVCVRCTLPVCPKHGIKDDTWIRLCPTCWTEISSLRSLTRNDKKWYSPLLGRSYTKEEVGHSVKSSFKVPAVPPPPPPPERVFYNEWQDGEEVTISVSDDVMNEFIEIILTPPTYNEIAGFGRIDNDELRWIYYDQESIEHSSSGAVKSDSANAMFACEEKLGVLPNLQWHTHPGFGAFASGTDRDDQGKDILRRRSRKESGHTYYMIADALKWVGYRVNWNPDGVTKHKIKFVYRDKVLHYPGSRPVVKSPAISTMKKPSNGKGKINNPLLDRTNYDDWHPDYEQYLLPAFAPVGPPDIEDEDVKTFWMGEWSNTPEDYDSLFDIFKVKRGDFLELEARVTMEFGERAYDVIIEDPDMWGSLTDYFGDKGNKNESAEAK